MTYPTEEMAVEAERFGALEEGGKEESLRLWECSKPAVIVGALGRIPNQVQEDACRQDGVPILRRLSGGGAVVVANGCLNFSLVLSLDRRPALHGVGESYGLILGAIVEALNLPGLAICGLSDIALGNRKVSGNAQRRGRRALLHHGTLLYDFDIRFLDRYLTEPERQPAYRCRRSHADFVANLSADPETIREAITLAWTRIQEHCRRSL